MQDFLAVNKLKFKELLKSNFPVTNYLFVISLPGNRSFKSLILVVTHGLSFFSTFNLLDPFHTQKESMYLLVNSVLHFR